MQVSSTRDATSTFVLTVTYRPAVGHPPTPRDHVMYGDSAPALVNYLCAAAHVFTTTITRVTIVELGR